VDEHERRTAAPGLRVVEWPAVHVERGHGGILQ